MSDGDDRPAGDEEPLADSADSTGDEAVVDGAVPDDLSTLHDTPPPDAPEAPAGDEAPMTVEDLVETLEMVTTQRDEYLDALQRLQADYENFRRRTQTETEQRVANGLSRIAESLLPVFDACDAAVGQGIEGVEPIASSLAVTLGKEGLERIEAVGQPFDPNEHEAVLHEAGDGGEQVVVEELRPGFRWQGRVLRAAMVKVRN